MNAVESFNLEMARARLEAHIASIPALADAQVAHDASLDVAELYAFSVTPRLTGQAGEALHLVGRDEMLAAGNAADFDALMARLGAGRLPAALDVHVFAHLFLRLRVLRRGVTLDRPDGHPLLRPGQLSNSDFAPPRVDCDAYGSRWRFWMFDTDRLEPVFWDVRVAPDGATTFTSQGGSSS